jgi:putative CocE/NonD family hydrolase
VTSSWRLPEATPFEVIEHCWIPMEDGTRLSARLWLPKGPSATRVPVVLEYIPYRKRDLYRAIDDLSGPMLARHGIAVARVDVRGTGESEGTIIDEYSPEELTDGVQCIDWLANQSWSSGAVGMRGISWGGFNTLQIAAMRPPALKAIMPMCCSDNRFTDDAHFIGGALGRTNFQWGLLFKLVMAGPPDPEIVGEAWERMWRARLETAPSILATWCAHHHFDAYWQRGSVALDYGAIGCPTYLVGGWRDTYNNAIGRLLENLSAPCKALIGPWGHTYPWAAEPLGLDWAREEVRWWLHWLEGSDTGIMDEPRFRAFMPYATAAEALPAHTPGRWIAEETWPSPRVRARRWHINEPGLAETKDRETRATYVGDTIVGLTKPEWLNCEPGEQSSDDAKSLVFDSSPLAEDLEILGQPTARLRLNADKPVATVAVRLTDVTPDGRSFLVAYALRNLAHRESHTAPEALVPGTDCDVALPMSLVAYRFKRGHRIRIAISESLWPLVWPSPSVATLTLTLGASSLDLPVRAMGDAPDAMPIPEFRTSSSAPPAPSISRESDGRVVVRNDSSSRNATLSDIGLTLSRTRTEEAAIAEGDPNSGCWTGEASTAWLREGFNCRIAASYAVRSTEEAFEVEERLVAFKDGLQIFERKSTRKISRVLI